MLFRAYIEPVLDAMVDTIEKVDNNVKINLRYADSECSDVGIMKTTTATNPPFKE